jgi:N-acetylneuraminic acid mutarotase
VALSKPACSQITLLSITFLIISGLSTTGLSSWKETAFDFISGQLNNIYIENNSLFLDTNYSLLENWSNIGEITSPTPRFGHSMVYDSINGVHLLFGGFDGNWQNDTWAYEMVSNKWTIQSIHKYGPPGRTMQSMAFDSRNGKVVMFGGFNAMKWSSYNDTWTYNYSTNIWHQATPISQSPEARSDHSMAYDPNNGQIVLFGGTDMYSGSSQKIINDTWTYNVSSGSWAQKFPTFSPLSRYDQSMCYDPSSGLIVLFGGVNAAGLTCQDTWTYDSTANTWTEQHPKISPPARVCAAMIADERDGTILLFGGRQASNTYNDTWSYNVTMNTWVELFPSGPSSRSDAAMTYDPTINKVFLYGGECNDEPMDDYWDYEPAQISWALLGEMASPCPRTRPGTTFDNSRGLGVLFGGRSDFFCFSDTWTFNMSVNQWERKHPILSPCARFGTSLCYDRNNDLTILFGGSSGGSSCLDTWTYNFKTNTWIEKYPAICPPTHGGSMAYDPNSQLVIYFGGDQYDHNNETWTYDATANIWTNHSNAVAPPGRAESVMVYDESSQLIILFGGINESCSFGDTWTFNTSTFSWSEKSPLTSPSARHGHAMAYNSKLGATLLYGGNDFEGSQLLGDTLAYNESIDNWKNLSVSMAPTPREGGCMFYDSRFNATILFGGWDAIYRGDTWIYSFLGYHTSGIYTSIPKDTGGNAYFGSLQWESTTPNKTNITMQIRTGTTHADIDSKIFSGPDGTANSFFITNGQRIPSMYNGSRWMQYRAYLTTHNILVTPILASVTINYNLLQNTDIISPKGDENWTGLQNITWKAIDNDNDSISFDIYLDYGTNSILLADGLSNETRKWAWNTTAVPNGTYRIHLVARDDNPSIPLRVDVVSNNFTVFHPVTIVNHSPQITSTPSSQAWVSREYIYNLTSIDEDGDISTYSIISAPTTMTLDSKTGKLRWTPTASDVGNHTVNVQVMDGHGGLDNQTFTITVKEIPPPPVISPKCAITYPTNGTTIRGAIQLKGTASNGSIPLGAIMIRIDNGTWIAAFGLENWTFNLNTEKLAKGNHRIEAQALAANLSSDTASVDFVVHNPEPGVSSRGNPWCLSSAIAIIMAGIAILILFKKRA